MNILIVTAHPSKTSVTEAIATTYIETKTAQGHTIQRVDLYAKEYEVPLLNFTNIREFQPTDVQKKFHEQILWANEIVVIHPIWWGVPPAIMKNWAELTFWPRVAYSYLPNGKVNKLLAGKTAKIFATAGGASWYYHFLVLPLLSFWELCVFGFCGVDVIQVEICGKLDVLKGEERDAKVKKFLETIKKSK